MACCRVDSGKDVGETGSGCCQVRKADRDTFDEEWSLTHVDPELKQYIVCIVNEEDFLCESDIPLVMEQFFNRFLECDGCTCLILNECEPVEFYDNVLYIMAEDTNTDQWIFNAVCCFCNYKAVLFMDLFNLQLVQFVIPILFCNMNLFEAFLILENQNEGLCTQQWTVTQRCPIDNCAESDRLVTDISPNESICVYIDPASKSYLEERDWKIKFCFWILEVEA